MSDGNVAGSAGFDPIWEAKYAAGLRVRYPWDAVVSFVYNHSPAGLPPSQIRVLEVGCGTASNLWFAAREGYSVSGVDASPSAIEAARKRFARDRLEGGFSVAEFTRLPFPDNHFHLAIDRAAITCSGFSAGAKAIAEVRRVLAPGGRFFFNPYSDGHSSRASGRRGPDGLWHDISEGTLRDVGPICFYGREDVELSFSAGWRILSMQHLVITELIGDANSVHSEWRVVATPQR